MRIELNDNELKAIACAVNFAWATMYGMDGEYRNVELAELIDAEKRGVLIPMMESIRNQIVANTRKGMVN